MSKIERKKRSVCGMLWAFFVMGVASLIRGVVIPAATVTVLDDPLTAVSMSSSPEPPVIRTKYPAHHHFLEASPIPLSLPLPKLSSAPLALSLALALSLGAPPWPLSLPPSPSLTGLRVVHSSRRFAFVSVRRLQE